MSHLRFIAANNHWTLEHALKTFRAPFSRMSRKYGDSNGNGSASLSDFAEFRGVFGQADGDTGLDSNRDGNVTLQDFAAFRGAFGS